MNELILNSNGSYFLMHLPLFSFFIASTLIAHPDLLQFLPKVYHVAIGSTNIAAQRFALELLATLFEDNRVAVIMEEQRTSTPGMRNRPTC